MTESGSPLSHLAYLALENALVTLELAPGALVTEKQLIARSGHGRTPVREAIQKLEWQGLIVVRPRVGLQVAEIRPQDHRQIMEVRHKLEPMAAGLAASNATPEQREGLMDCARAMTSAAATGDYGGFLTADKQFDEILEASCPNPFLIAALAPLQTHSRRLWFAARSPEKMDRSVSLHVAVIRAIQQQDADQARQMMERLISDLTET
ncbi:GntR family transcriptional regulator [Peteryoungia desertarenae]|uniref:GntR family transcriptional regulator n=1 Tax=Peteryoungia desertarenae TaxID=1813451 RepID=A0ABX6QPH1_9HYPH|nr:GntR family transcriptional regulator [Peteryoungia desertarenae]QLF70428.1 GntR family transcriptional regulator [Peteryoungia desertarenae]